MQGEKIYQDDFVPISQTETVVFPGIGAIELEDIPSVGHCEILLQRREQLGLTQQNVADDVGIQRRQYQRFESGERLLSASSLRISLAICDVLKLDPHRFV